MQFCKNMLRLYAEFISHTPLSAIGLKNVSFVFVVGAVLTLAPCGKGAAAVAGPLPPTAWAESGGLDTPDYAATVAWCEAAAAASDAVTFTSFGASGQGRDLPLLVYDRRGRFTPGRRDGRVVVMLQACIHAGESCGKDAGMELLRALDDGSFAGRFGVDLDRTTFLFIPIFNVDGHERFGPYGRINQNGPREMGWRTTASNLNLNRDYLKADTPEMQAWLALWNAWSPDFFIDAHSTDGADYQYALTYSLETRGNLDPDLTAWVKAYESAMHEQLEADGWPMFPYVTFKEWHDPKSGLRTWVAGPRFSQGYAAVRNRPGLLIETHMLKDYPTRVEATIALVGRTLAWVESRHDELAALNAAADRRTASPEFRAEPFPLRFTSTEASRPVPFRGVAYRETTSAVTGGAYMVFSGTPETWELDWYDEVQPEVTARLPEAYLVPPEWTDVIARLRWHGVAVKRLAEPVVIEARTWRLVDPQWRSEPYEGRHPVTCTAEPLVESRTWPAGTVVVDMNQPAARAAAHLLEPQGPDALVQWGFFDPIFTRTEYVESYVIERMIPGLLEQHPEWAAELEALKADDPDFAANPWAIRDWFYRRTPYYDSRVGIYPVGCVDSRAALAALPLH
jgi:hypothetical protein